MKIRGEYLLSEIAGVPVAVPLGNQTSFHNTVKLNGTGKLLWEKLQAGASREDLVTALTAEYDVTADVAGKDVDLFTDNLRSLGILED